MRSLVIGGTGPTGHFVVNGLRARGHDVAILHTGRHEIPEIPPQVEHIHTDPFSDDAVRQALGSRSFDICFAMYGRLRRLAALMAGRCGQFISVGGVPAYRGYSHPALFEPPGLPVPTPEDAPLVRERGDDEKGWRIVRTEQALFEAQPDATHYRYPYVYGPYQLTPREWCVVRRALDGRRHLILPDGGLTLSTFGYAENLAHALLLAVDRPDAARGQIYNCGDEEVLSLRQVAEVLADALDHRFEYVSIPWEFAAPARPLVMQPLTTHRVLDLSKLRTQLGYRDVVSARQALQRTARWLVDHPPKPGGPEEQMLQDPFDYAAEDALIAAWQQLCAALPQPSFAREPGYGRAYSGPGGRARSSADFE